MTPKQTAFIDYYLETQNATESAKRSGYSKRTAYSIGQENLNKPVIKSEIKRRMAEKEAERIASADEVLKGVTAIFRGDEQNGDKPNYSARLRAAEILCKCHQLYGQKIELTTDDNPVRSMTAQEKKARIDELLKKIQ